MTAHNWQESYLRLHPLAALKRLEEPYLYHLGRDELYEIDEKALAFLSQCDGTRAGADLTDEDAFVRYCLSEGLLEAPNQPQSIKIMVGEAPVPSLRYLELQLTRRCNLRCRHCYLGTPQDIMLALPEALKVTNEFSARGGLRLLISGGEPLLYPHLAEFITATADLKLHRVLLTNGTRISRKNIADLRVENIQFSLDGWQAGHEALRGPGTFSQTMTGIDAAREAGIPVSIATMIHQGNTDEFDRMQAFVQEIRATEWGIDVMGVSGSLHQNKQILVSSPETAPLMAYAFGGGYHGPSDGYTCGRHLMTVLPSGQAVKCGFYESEPLGDARQGLIECWQKLRHVPLSELECGECKALEECAGGCRFRGQPPGPGSGHV